MADELNTNAADPVFVDPNTDDLDAFNDLMSGRAKPLEEAPEKVEEKPDDKSTPQDVDSDVDDDDEDLDETDSETPDGEEGEGDEPKPEDEKPPKKTNRYQERIDELTAKAREAERREKEVLRRLDELAAKQNPTPTEDKQPSPSKPDLGPTPDDVNEDGSDKYPLGEFDPSYIRDLTRHTIQAETAAANERSEQERVQRESTQAREELNNQWTAKLTTASASHEDFMEKTIQLEDTFEGLDAGYSDYLVQTIKSLDHGPDVLYHFANNLDEAKEFVKLGPLAATLALGEMNARFKQPKSQEAPKPTKVSNAPPPPQVQNKGTKQRTSVAADTDDLDAFSRDFFAPKKRR